ncbi:MAG: peptide deformylase [Patescibacteria group bacterium]
MITEIKQKNDPILRRTAAPVADTLPSARVNKIIDLMRRALAAQADGVALAAPQIGVSEQIFIVKNDAGSKKLLVFINPRLVKRSRRQAEMVEGCLSVRGIYGHIKRREKVTVAALDENGRRFTLHTSGLLAQIVQHEFDHLRGVLFTDHAYDLTEVK